MLDCVKIMIKDSVLYQDKRSVLDKAPGVIQKLHGQDEVDRWSKNASFCPRLG